MAKHKREEYNWIDDPFDEKKAAKERAQMRGGTGAAAVGCVVVVIALVILIFVAMVGGLGILSELAL